MLSIMKKKIVLIIIVAMVFIATTIELAETATLKMGMPNVCEEESVKVTRVVKPCVKALTRRVKVWTQNCGDYQRRWCVGYERRTHYYTAYKIAYETKRSVSAKCCKGWTQLNNEAGCTYPQCAYGVCFNGGRCQDSVTQMCQCAGGFSGARCENGKVC